MYAPVFNAVYASEHWYLPEKTTSGPGPLTAECPITVGYGPLDADPWSFTLPDGANDEVNFFKLYASREPLNLTSILQKSPFIDSDPPEPLEKMIERGRKQISPRRQPDIWVSETITLVLKRKDSDS